jgi:DNA-binding IclR family transcriptional regulator
MIAAKKGGFQIRSVAKSLMILDLLSESRQGMPLTAIARKMEMAKSTVHGLLSTMRDYGFVEQSEFDGNYKLGNKLFELGSKVADNWDVHRIAPPYMQKLVDAMKETVHLVVLDKGEVLYIDKYESEGTQSFQIVSKIGSRLPAHCTGVGKVLLAFLPPQEAQQIISQKGLTRYTKNTITDPAGLELEFQKIRNQGFAEDNEEIMDSLRCVAAPIWDYNGKVSSAISISGPSTRMNEEKMQLCTKYILQIAKEISVCMGYRP